MEKLVFGTAGIPISTEPRNYANAFSDLVKMNLGALEVEFVRGVNMNPKTQVEVKELASELDLAITAHGPYYINLNSQEEDKVQASIKRILDTARVAYNFGGYSITFHAAYYMGGDKETVYSQVKKTMTEIVETLKSEGVNIWVRPELTGKGTQWGDLDELIRLSNDVEMVLPCIDFSHLYARTVGQYNTYDEFCQILEKIGKGIGEHALKDFHAHVAGMNYGPKGEKNHLMFKESDFNYKDLLKALKTFDVKGVIICESPIMEEDAVNLLNEYKTL